MLSKKTETVVTFTGSNDDLLERKSVSNLDLSAKIIVPESHYAILIKDGQLFNTLGAGKHNIFDEKSEKKNKSLTVEVIYLSKTYKLKGNWGTRARIVHRDPETDIRYSVGARGEFELQISNPKKVYLELIGVEKDFTLERLHDHIISRVSSEVERELAGVLNEINFSYDDVENQRNQLAKAVLPELSKMLDEEYGLKVFSFTCDVINIRDEEKAAIEEKKKQLKEKREKEEEEKRAKLEEETKDNRAWERTRFMLELRLENYEKYLEVCKIIGWEPEPRIDNGARAKRFCGECGAAYGRNDKFCPGCGRPIGNTKKTCTKCGKVNEADAKFCSGCGEKL